MIKKIIIIMMMMLLSINYTYAQDVTAISVSEWIPSITVFRTYYTDDLNIWNKQTNNFNNVIYANSYNQYIDKYIGVRAGDGGDWRLVESNNGITWTDLVSGIFSVYGITGLAHNHNDDSYMIVRGTSSYLFINYIDSNNNIHNIYNSDNLKKVIYNPIIDKYISISDDKIILFEFNEITNTSTINNVHNSTSTMNNIFFNTITNETVIVGNTITLISTNGVNWTEINHGYNLIDITYNNNFGDYQAVLSTYSVNIPDIYDNNTYSDEFYYNNVQEIITSITYSHELEHYILGHLNGYISTSFGGYMFVGNQVTDGGNINNILSKSEFIIEDITPPPPPTQNDFSYSEQLRNFPLTTNEMSTITGTSIPGFYYFIVDNELYSYYLNNNSQTYINEIPYIDPFMGCMSCFLSYNYEDDTLLYYYTDDFTFETNIVEMYTNGTQTGRIIENVNQYAFSMNYGIDTLGDEYAIIFNENGLITYYDINTGLSVKNITIPNFDDFVFSAGQMNSMPLNYYYDIIKEKLFFTINTFFGDWFIVDYDLFTNSTNNIYNITNITTGNQRGYFNYNGHELVTNQGNDNYFYSFIFDFEPPEILNQFNHINLGGFDSVLLSMNTGYTNNYDYIELFYLDDQLGSVYMNVSRGDTIGTQSSGSINTHMYYNSTTDAIILFIQGNNIQYNRTFFTQASNSFGSISNNFQVMVDGSIVPSEPDVITPFPNVNIIGNESKTYHMDVYYDNFDQITVNYFDDINGQVSLDIVRGGITVSNDGSVFVRLVSVFDEIYLTITGKDNNFNTEVEILVRNDETLTVLIDEFNLNTISYGMSEVSPVQVAEFNNINLIGFESRYFNMDNYFDNWDWVSVSYADDILVQTVLLNNTRTGFSTRSTGSLDVRLSPNFNIDTNQSELLLIISGQNITYPVIDGTFTVTAWNINSSISDSFQVTVAQDVGQQAPQQIASYNTLTVLDGFESEIINFNNYYKNFDFVEIDYFDSCLNEHVSLWVDRRFVSTSAQTSENACFKSVLRSLGGQVTLNMVGNNINSDTIVDITLSIIPQVTTTHRVQTNLVIDETITDPTSIQGLLSFFEFDNLTQNQKIMVAILVIFVSVLMTQLTRKDSFLSSSTFGVFIGVLLFLLFSVIGFIPIWITVLVIFIIVAYVASIIKGTMT